MGDGGEPQEGLGGRSHERRGIGTEKRTEISSSVVYVGVNGGSPGSPGSLVPTGEREWDGARWVFVGKTQEPQPYSRTVRIGMISVVPEEEEEDINMESYGKEGYEHEYNGEYTDTEGEEATPPEYTTADEGYQTREEEDNGYHQDPPPYPQSEDSMEVAGPAGQLVVREPDLWGDSQHDYPQLFMATQISPLQGIW